MEIVFVERFILELIDRWYVISDHCEQIKLTLKYLFTIHSSYNELFRIDISTKLNNLPDSQNDSNDIISVHYFLCTSKNDSK